ncbi:rare lipoprotein A [Legionella gratiana]|uniref:Endolytic peptidoglycan transglycosylase RlpA n=1 Tax=Legionella gratiana TaxID=45066 RepID=A0A378JCN6_9GAMM|nr:septal ring lytic transglycosylase RlpA family protein [Legionella gratiana]KTD15651.1 rare lipoprotein A [Legionella gratiana]STX44828.1 rare lipoprotein A [Legionella gratiana]
MRKILIAMTILLTGCQTTNQSLDTASSSGKKTTRHTSQSPNSSIYNRYKNKTNRYTQFQDGAPTKQKKVSFREPVPTKEPLSRYGNPSEYSVDGRSYQVMRNSSGYKTRGVASWYGTKFHKQRTSSGEPYNMYVMSAAHRTLPLPTYIKVKNLDNGKEAIVKVNDRGPFHSNRIIDLSYAAALKLGVFPKGTANVEIETLAGPKQARYYIQAGAFTTEASAKRLKEKLVRITTSPVTIERYHRNYIVRIGPFGAKNTADSLKHKLALNGVNGTFSVLI